MKVNLAKLLNLRQIIKPNQLKRVVNHGDDQLEIVIEGYSWWTERTRKPAFSEISFLFCGLLDGGIDVTDLKADEFGNDLENFEVTWVEESLFCELFCSTPLKDPWNIFKLVHDAQVRSGMRPNPFQVLNADSNQLFDSFERIVGSKAYKLFSGPRTLAEVIAPELAKQQVEFQMINVNGPSGFYRVSWKDSQFTCREALAICKDGP